MHCDGGILITADGATTLADVYLSSRKIVQLGNETAVAVSGDQRTGGLVKEALKEVIPVLDKHPAGRLDFVKQVRATMWDVIREELEVARESDELTGRDDRYDLGTSMLLGRYIDGEPLLATFDHLASPRIVDPSDIFDALGSGLLYASAFLGLIRRIAWPDRQPTLEEGRFASMWTMRQVIHTMAGGVADPVQMLEITSTGLVHLSSEELRDHDGAVTDLENHIVAWLRGSQQSIPPDIIGRRS